MVLLLLAVISLLRQILKRKKGRTKNKSSLSDHAKLICTRIKLIGARKDAALQSANTQI